MSTLFINAFDAIALQRDSHPAIITDGVTAVSYAELRAKALRIAAHLPKGDDGRPIAICIEKSAGYLAAALACWYAGAAFLPLDPELPASRRAHIIAGAQPLCILTAGQVDLDTSCPQLDIRALADAPFTQRPDINPDSTAYVIYTSGSTGAPKGVIVSHRGLLPVLQQQIKLFDLNADTRSLFYLSISFDASISDFGTALLAGGTLYIESAGKLATASQLAQIIAARGITYADLPPALLRLLDPATMPSCLRSICIGGEVCPPAVVRRWAQDRRIVCVYGPTEATICTSASICDPQHWQSPLIGTPLDGVDYSIRDTAYKPTDEGELYIAGPHLADGYLGQAELTAQKFVTIDSKRWYRSGDHVRRTQDGIEFIGRIDRQFKWRGQLVEPEEIEQALCHIEGISRAAVMRLTDNKGDRLVAHIESVTAQDTAAIQSQLAKILSAWMIPTSVITHDHMPLTATGKINRSVLAARSESDAHRDSAPFVAVGAQQQALLRSWQRVLNRQDIPAQAPFSALGGDSFATLQLLLEAEKEGLSLSPDFVSRYTSISAQARHLHDDSAHDTMQSAKDLRAHVLANFPILAPAPQQQDQGDILLTGATGFLGRQLLDRLLEASTRTIHIIMRAQSPQQGLARLALAPHHHDRIRIHCGDIAQEGLGLAATDWQDIGDHCDTIVHCAATVNMALDYRALENSNVRAVHSLLCLASTGRAKHIHHASTLSVFVATDQNTGVAREDDQLNNTDAIYGGYAQSKWAAEILLLAAAQNEHHITLHRLGLITGDSASGQSSSHDFLRTFMQGVISLGHIPAGTHDTLLLDATPVDYAADLMASAISGKASGTLHIANTRGFSWPQIMHALRRHGHIVSEIAPDAWDSWLAQRRAQSSLTPEETAAVMAMCRALPAPSFDRNRAMDLFQATGITFDNTRIKEKLGSSWRVPPAADDALLDLYIRNFQLRPMRAKKASIA